MRFLLTLANEVFRLLVKKDTVLIQSILSKTLEREREREREMRERERRERERENPNRKQKHHTWRITC